MASASPRAVDPDRIVLDLALTQREIDFLMAAIGPTCGEISWGIYQALTPFESEGNIHDIHISRQGEAHK